MSTQSPSTTPEKSISNANIKKLQRLANNARRELHADEGDYLNAVAALQIAASPTVLRVILSELTARRAGDSTTVESKAGKSGK